MSRKAWSVFLFILIIAIFLRIIGLDKVPPALFGDEIDVGYQAYSILKTGQDLYGQVLPVYIKSLAEHRAPLLMYSAVPFIKIFGLNVWGVRLTAAFWGVISIIGLFLLLKKLFNQKIALVGMLLLSISPWHLQYSRAGFEVTMLLAFEIFFSYFFLLGLEKRKYWLLAAIIFGLTPYIYSTAVVFSSLLLILLLVNYKNQTLSYKKALIIPALFFLIVVFPFLKTFYLGQAGERFGVISIFQDSVLQDKLNLAKKAQNYLDPEGNIKSLSLTKERIFHNKFTVYGQVFAQNYIQAFSFDFLFARGDPNIRHSIQEMGELYYFELILIVLGIWFLLQEKSLRTKMFIFGWLLLAPIPSSLTKDGNNHATRLILMLPPLVTLSSLGAYLIGQRLKNNYYKILGAIVILIACANIIFYFHRYWLHYPVESWRWWQTGFKEALTLIDQNKSNYRYVIINNTYEPSLERYLFYSQYEPSLFHQQFKLDQPIVNILPGINGFTLDEHVYFGTISSETKDNGGIDKIMNHDILYLASAHDEVDVAIQKIDPQNYTVLKTIVSPAGEPIFYILAGKQ